MLLAFEQSDVIALGIVVDELDTYLDVMGQDIREVQGEAQLEKLQWAATKLHRVLAKVGENDDEA